VCGAGGGGVVLAVVKPRERQALIEDLDLRGFRILEAKIDRVGLEVQAETV
jgi:galactokinase/mevalonate kinase-like predicted kinase